MSPAYAAQLDVAVAALPLRHQGPGGAVAVLRDGEVLVRHAWGFADVAKRLPFTPQSMSLICSITKQFTCSLLLDVCPDPTVLDAEVSALLPNLQQAAPGALDLAHNQSGLRDYWALAMLCGAPVEGYFGDVEAERLISRTRTLHFAPGTRYSYVNQNFRILGDLVARRASGDFATLLRRRILDRVGMPTAQLNPDTSQVVGGTIGYEGTVESGFRPAVNNIFWTGDAGMAASLDDMIAWERFIDATRDDPAGLYNRLSAPQNFRDGAPAGYGFGLAQVTMQGRKVTCHGGALRGWRSFRLHAAAERLSVVVLFNHMGNPGAAAAELFAAALGEPTAATGTVPDAAWVGRYAETETGLAARVAITPGQGMRLHYATQSEALTADFKGDPVGDGVHLSRVEGAVWMERPADNLKARLQPLADGVSMDVAGVFRSEELGADLTCVLAGGALYGAFSGDLGQGTMEPLIPFAKDVWLLPCPRALDHFAPGDWTLTFLRGADGQVDRLQVGCWLARDITYTRVS